MHVKWSKPEELPYDGLLKVRVIAPKNLKMPLLPARIDDMLLFANCLNCAVIIYKLKLISLFLRKWPSHGLCM
jgi:hypothetical protein